MRLLWGLALLHVLGTATAANAPTTDNLDDIYTNEVFLATARCSACYAVSNEIRRMLEQEKQGHDIKLSSRLDSKGNYHKVKNLEYEGSELRMLEVLDLVCENMKDYGLMELDNQHGKWSKTKNNDGPLNLEGALRLGPKVEPLHRVLRSVCDAAIEEYEDEIVETIRSKAIQDDPKVFDKLLCGELTRYCKDAERVIADSSQRNGKSYEDNGLHTDL